jgi:hypothetical protein
MRRMGRNAGHFAGRFCSGSGLLLLASITQGASMSGAAAIGTNPDAKNQTDQSPSARNTASRPHPRSVVRIIRSDALKLTRSNRLCVRTEADPAVLGIIESSGERMGPSDVESLSMETAIALSQALRDRGIPTAFPDADVSQRVVALVQYVSERHCDRADPIHIEQRLLAGARRQGYRVRLSASQGRRSYVVETERPHAIAVFGEERFSMADEADSRYDGSPFWSARGDLFRLRAALVGHLFRGDGK